MQHTRGFSHHPQTPRLPATPATLVPKALVARFPKARMLYGSTNVTRPSTRKQAQTVKDENGLKEHMRHRKLEEFCAAALQDEVRESLGSPDDNGVRLSQP